MTRRDNNGGAKEVHCKPAQVLMLDPQQSPNPPPSRLHPWIDGPVPAGTQAMRVHRVPRRCRPHSFPLLCWPFLRSTSLMAPHPQLASPPNSRPSHLQAGACLSFFGSTRQVVGLCNCSIGNKLEQVTLTPAFLSTAFCFLSLPFYKTHRRYRRG